MAHRSGMPAPSLGCLGMWRGEGGRLARHGTSMRWARLLAWMFGIMEEEVHSGRVGAVMSPTYQLGLCRRGLMSQCGGTRAPNWTTQRAFLLGPWLGVATRNQARAQNTITHWAVIAPSTRDPLGALARELGLSPRVALPYRVPPSRSIPCRIV